MLVNVKKKKNLKKNNKIILDHDQIDKSLGKDLYDKFVAEVKEQMQKFDPEAIVQQGTYGQFFFLQKIKANQSPSFFCFLLGNRQGLKFESSGPNCHILEF